MTDQPRMFDVDGVSIDEYRASLGAAGYVALDEPLRYKGRVTITAAGYVGKVIAERRSDGRTIRRHVIVVDNESLVITATGELIADDVEATTEDDELDQDDDNQVDAEVARELQETFA